MDFGAITGAVTDLAAISDDENEIREMIELEVIIGDGDEIEIELEPRNVRDKESQEKTGPSPDRKKQDQMTENDEEELIENEDDQENNSGVSDTMLTSPDFLEDEERELQYILAPGQGRTPVSVFKDKYSEELAYPYIYYGQSRQIGELLKIQMIFSSKRKSCRWRWCWTKFR